jgi:protein-S-isoprenylcysteine O-methyltransferase Ste14
MTGLYLGAACVLDVLWTLLLLAAMHWGVICREERYLESRFGCSYLDYKSNTRRWL